MKKLLFSLLSFVFMISCGLYIYKCTLKQEVSGLYSTVLASDAESTPNQMSATLKVTADTVETVETQLKNQSVIGTNVYFFYKPDNNDSIYMNDNLLSPMIAKEGVAAASIQFIDLSALPETFLPSAMKKNWGFDTFPALVQANYKEDGTLEVLSTLQWTKDIPLTDYDLKQWLTSVGLISQAKEDLGIPIEKPIE